MMSMMKVEYLRSHCHLFSKELPERSLLHFGSKDQKMIGKGRKLIAFWFSVVLKQRTMTRRRRMKEAGKWVDSN